MSGYDIVVVGLGAMGSALADRAAARGASVLGLERFGPAHDRGSSHGESRIIRQAYFEHPSYVPLLGRAYELWTDLEARSGRRLLTMTGGLMIGRPGSRTITGSRTSAEQWRLPHELLEAADLRERFPTFAVADEDVALYEERAGFIRPEETVRAQLDLAERAGAELRFGEPVAHWSADGAGVHVVTDRAGYSADRLALCPGAWAPGVLRLDVPLHPQRQVMHWFLPADEPTPFGGGQHPVYVWEDAAGGQMYGVPPVSDGSGAKVGLNRYQQRPCDPDRVDRSVHPEEVAEIVDLVRDRLPGLGRHDRAITCLYTVSPDNHFVLGPHPHDDRVVVAAGFSGHGFKFTPVVGEILADLSLTGRTGHDIALFDPRRRRPAPEPGAVQS
jgi:sarcosine oxidase